MVRYGTVVDCSTTTIKKLRVEEKTKIDLLQVEHVIVLTLASTENTILTDDLLCSTVTSDC